MTRTPSPSPERQSSLSFPQFLRRPYFSPFPATFRTSPESAARPNAEPNPSPFTLLFFPISPLPYLSPSSVSTPSPPCCRPNPAGLRLLRRTVSHRAFPPLFPFSLLACAALAAPLTTPSGSRAPPVSERQRRGSEMGGAAFRWLLQLHRDVPKAARFYSEGLDFNINVCTLRWAELQNGPLKLALMHSPTRCPSLFLLPLYVLSFLFHFSSLVSTYL